MQCARVSTVICNVYLILLHEYVIFHVGNEIYNPS